MFPPDVYLGVRDTCQHIPRVFHSVTVHGLKRCWWVATTLALRSYPHPLSSNKWLLKAGTSLQSKKSWEGTSVNDARILLSRQYKFQDAHAGAGTRPDRVCNSGKGSMMRQKHRGNCLRQTSLNDEYPRTMLQPLSSLLGNTYSNICVKRRLKPMKHVLALKGAAKDCNQIELKATADRLQKVCG